MDNNQQYTSKGKKALGYGVTTLGALVVGGLIAGGGTLALWNDSVTSESYEFQSGNLEIAQTSEGIEITNVTDGGMAYGEELDKDNLIVVPGETYLVTQGFDIALEGKNLIGNIDTTDLQAAIETSAQSEAGEDLVEVTSVRVLDGNGNELETAGVNTYSFASEDTQLFYPGNDASTQHTVSAEFDDAADFVVEYEVEFSPDAVNSEAQNDVVATINPIEVEIQQQATWG